MNEKIISYIHFAFRSKKAFLGLNRLEETNKKKIKLIILNNNLSLNSKEKIEKEFSSIQIYSSQTGKEIFEKLNLINYKVLFFLKSKLADTILKELQI